MSNNNDILNDLDLFIAAGADSDDSEVVDTRTEEEKKEYHQKMDALGETFLMMIKGLREDGDKIFGEGYVELETRQMNVSLPPSAWEALDTIKKLFDTFHKYGSDKDLPQELRGTKDFFQKKFNTNNIEDVFLTQSFFESIFNFCANIAEIEIARKLREAQLSSDPEAATERVIKLIDQLLGG